VCVVLGIFSESRLYYNLSIVVAVVAQGMRGSQVRWPCDEREREIWSEMMREVSFQKRPLKKLIGRNDVIFWSRPFTGHV
jgi:hypothetical protein